jgi:adenylate kinase
LVSERARLIQISTGDMLRQAVKEGTPLGMQAKRYMEAGELVPDTLVIDMLKDRIAKPDSGAGVILDGFPRTIPQAEALKKSTLKIDAVINFAASEETIVQRLSGRRTCPKCGAIFHIVNIKPKKEGICDKCGAILIQREDDKPDAIKERLVVYKRQTEPLIAFYRKLNLLKDVNAEQELEKIYSDTAKAMSIK